MEYAIMKYAMNLRNKPRAEGTKCRHAQPMNPPKKQNGVVLFVALIALVVMSLAAVALIRSVDTNTIIAGNLAFKQAAISSADSGLETAIAWLISKTPTDETALQADDLANGYYSSYVADPKTRFATGSKLASGGNITPGTGTDTSLNTISYVVERMCSATGPATTLNCLYGAPADSTSSKGVKDAPGAGGPAATGNSVMFRVTISVAGPKNTVGSVQAYIY
jgi:type IV pilus assembly protein PilX